MTNKEALNILHNASVYHPDYLDALNIAINALEQELPNDAVDCDFEIGDEVRIIGSDIEYDDCDVGWVLQNASEQCKTMYVMRNDGSASEENKSEWYRTGRHNAMLKEVIKALPAVNPQEPKIDEDCISREKTIEKFCDYVGAGMSMNDFDALFDIVVKMPSVKLKTEQEPKIWHWEFEKTVFDRYGLTVRCPSCHKKWKTYDEIRWAKENKYCPNCGAKTESEEQINHEP